MANNATLAGHVEIDDFAIIGGLSAVHQFVKIGAHAMIGGMSAVQKDVLPFSVIMGERAKLAGINIIGMKRRNFTRKEIKSIQELYDFIFWNKNENENLTNLQDKINIAEQKYKGYDVVQNVIDFIKHDSNRAICGPKN
jgi:UDP-N-acetylglucosamine acyltransferase